MAGPRQLVPPPTFAPRNFGLLSVVQPRWAQPDGSPTPDEHWRNGVTWTDICGMGASIVEAPCASGIGTPTKESTTDTLNFGAQPFTVYDKVDCSPVGFSREEESARAADALTRSEQFQVERAFWTGAVSSAAGVTSAVYPHLAADAAVEDSLNISLQCAATLVTGSVVLDIVEGLGRLESAMAQCYGGQLTIHIPLILGQALFEWGLVKADGAQLKTMTGNLVALGGGYTGSSPAGVLTPNVAWIYATGPVFAYRSNSFTFRFPEMFDRSTNTLETIVERTYVLGFTCCCMYATPISVGGDITGQPLSAF